MEKKKIKLDEHGQLVTKREKIHDWAPESWFFGKPEVWVIYKEPKKPVTYEDALKASKVRVYWRHDPEKWVSIFTKVGYWTRNEMMAFDFAERKNYKMEIIE